MHVLCYTFVKRQTKIKKIIVNGKNIFTDILVNNVAILRNLARYENWQKNSIIKKKKKIRRGESTKMNISFCCVHKDTPAHRT